MASLKRLRNLTLHPQGSRETKIAAEAGYALGAEPEGALVGPGRDGLESTATRHAELLSQAAAESSAVLIGGHTGLWIRALEILLEKRIPRPNLAYFETERVHDGEGRFVFKPTGLVTIESRESEDKVQGADDK